MTCSWTPDPGCNAEAWAALETDVQDRSLMLATSSLLTLTYNRVGTCPVTVRPCPAEATCGCAWSPYNLDGVWYNSCPCRSRCEPPCEIDLPGPVGFIKRIMIDGVEHDPASGDWRVDEGHYLVWQGTGDCPFPETNDLSKPDTEVGTYSITYSRSYPVAQDGRLAVALLAQEFAKACAPKGKCSLPKGVTNVVRSGVSFTIEAGLFPGGLTGIEIVDQFILKWAPAGAPTKPAFVFDPRSLGRRSRNTHV